MNNKLKKYLSVAAVFSLLWITGTIVNTHAASAQGPQIPAAPVNIVNPLPVPVSGTVSVGNLGNTTIPVSVTNFPATQQVSGTVNVGNLPSLQSITVTNAPGSSPFTGSLDPGTSQFPVPVTIGNNKSVQALVVTEVSGFCTGIGFFNLGLQDFLGGTEVNRYYFRVQDVGTGSVPGNLSVFPILAQQSQIYFAPGHSIVLADATPGNGCHFNLSGYYVTQ